MVMASFIYSIVIRVINFSPQCFWIVFWLQYALWIQKKYYCELYLEINIVYWLVVLIKTFEVQKVVGRETFKVNTKSDRNSSIILRLRVMMKLWIQSFVGAYQLDHFKWVANLERCTSCGSNQPLCTPRCIVSYNEFICIHNTDKIPENEQKFSTEPYIKNFAIGCLTID